MNDDSIHVEIVAPVHNRRDISLQCLRSLSRIDTTGLNVHIVIVDDGSTDGTGDAIRDEFPNVEVVPGDGNLWFTEGSNVGIRAALKYDPKYVLAINDDSIFEERFLRYMVETAEKHPHSIVGSLLLLWDEPHKIFQVAPVWSTWLGGWQHWYQQTTSTIPVKPWKVEVIVGNCVLLPAEAIRNAGLMNSLRYPNFGDAEYTSRFRKLGWDLLLDPRARVFCKPNDLPRSVFSLGPRKAFKVLLFDRYSGSNLIQQFRLLWDTAPSRFQGAAAFFLFYVRILWQKLTGRRLSNTERPMAEVYKV